MFRFSHEELARSVLEMSSLPPTTVRLTGLIASDEIDLDQVVHVIECDPGLTFKLLRIANSVSSSSCRRIGTVKEALIRLGTGAVLGVAIGSCMRPIVMKVIPGYNISGTDFWRHSLTAALATESMRTFSKTQFSQLAFTAALMHDIGKLLLGKTLDPETVKDLADAGFSGDSDSHRTEFEVLSLHHGGVGGMVARYWGMPDTIANGVTFHHEPELCQDEIARIVRLADYVAHVVNLDRVNATNPKRQPEDLNTPDDAKQLGLSDASLSKVINATRLRLTAVAAEFN